MEIFREGGKEKKKKKTDVKKEGEKRWKKTDKEQKEGCVEVKRQTTSHLRNGLINTIDRTDRGGARWSCGGALQVN